MTTLPKKRAATPVEPVRQLTARARIRELVNGELELRDEIHLTDLSTHIVSLLRSDPTFLEMFVQEVLPSAVYNEVHRLVARTRGLERMGDFAATVQVMEKRRQAFASRFASWYEHAGERSIKLLEMTREDLLEAAEERKKRGRTEIRIALLWEKLADGMEGGQKVGDKFTTDDIEVTYSEIEAGE